MTVLCVFDTVSGSEDDSACDGRGMSTGGRQHQQQTTARQGAAHRETHEEKQGDSYN